jgi:hypothetical protein
MHLRRLTEMEIPIVTLRANRKAIVSEILLYDPERAIIVSYLRHAWVNHEAGIESMPYVWISLRAFCRRR